MTLSTEGKGICALIITEDCNRWSFSHTVGCNGRVTPSRLHLRREEEEAPKKLNWQDSINIEFLTRVNCSRCTHAHPQVISNTSAKFQVHLKSSFRINVGNRHTYTQIPAFVSSNQHYLLSNWLIFANTAAVNESTQTWFIFRMGTHIGYYCMFPNNIQFQRQANNQTNNINKRC